jgi:hypothetical protein
LLSFVRRASRVCELLVSLLRSSTLPRRPQFFSLLRSFFPRRLAYVHVKASHRLVPPLQLPMLRGYRLFLSAVRAQPMLLQRLFVRSSEFPRRQHSEYAEEVRLLYS